MKNPMEIIQRSPDQNQNDGDFEQKEVLNELKAIPIFRNNDLYAELFPEIKALFEKGEEPNIKKIFDSIKANQGKEVVLDKTCYDVIYNLDLHESNLADFPIEFKLKKIPENLGAVDMDKLTKLFKKNFNVTLSPYDDQTIDRKIAKALDYNFSPELAKGLLEIAKQKNQNIKQIYILSDNISDHVGQFPKDKVIDTLKESIKSEFNLESKVIPTISFSDILDGDLVIVDRHNPSVSSMGFEKLNEKIPKQTSLLPIETEIYNNEKFLKQDIHAKSITKELRKIFEKDSK